MSLLVEEDVIIFSSWVRTWDRHEWGEERVFFWRADHCGPYGAVRSVYFLHTTIATVVKSSIHAWEVHGTNGFPRLPPQKKTTIFNPPKCQLQLQAEEWEESIVLGNADPTVIS